MSADFDSIQSLLGQVHAEAQALAPPTDLPSEELEEAGPGGEDSGSLERQEAIAAFKSEILGDPALSKKLKKYRREGFYAIKPWQIATLALGIPVLVILSIYFAYAFSNKTLANQAIQKGIDAIYDADLLEANAQMATAIDYGADEATIRIQFGAALLDMDWPDSALEYFDLAARLANTKQDKGRFAMAAINAAEVEMENGRINEAEARLTTVLRTDPKHREALILRGRILVTQAKYEIAKEAFNGALERNSTSLTPHYYLREIALKQNRLSEAKEQEDVLLYSRPSGDEDVPTMFGYANLLVREGRLREAEDVLLKVRSRQKRENPEIMVSLGHLAVEMLDIGTAELYAESSVLLAPTFPDGYLLRGEIAYSKGLGSQALQDFKKALALSPRHPKALYDMGCLLLFDLNLYQQGLDRLEAAAANGFDGPFLWYNIGAARYFTRRPREALAAFDKSPSFVQKSSEALWAIANTHLLNNSVDTALEIYLELRKSQERNPGLDNNIGLALEMAGKKDLALQRYWGAVRMARNPESADTVARSNVERIVLGQAIDDPWNDMHSDIPLRLAGVVVPRRSRRGF